MAASTEEADRQTSLASSRPVTTKDRWASLRKYTWELSSELYARALEYIYGTCAHKIQSLEQVKKKNL